MSKRKAISAWTVSRGLFSPRQARRVEWVHALSAVSAPGLSPALLAYSLSMPAQRRLLAAEILRLARQSYRTKGITNDLERVDRLKQEDVPRRRYRFFVYKRDGRPCYRCETPIERFDQGGRAIFVCPLCQPEIP